ncbi:flagellar hook protein FlgE [Terricaulis silvestris]|uniref:Flagellar hook protein FlgE n=1 Tax=Terricaulis silvestris TaxID=2686094 RepID=A0A6I6MG99_9CAUL|nr:flagellar hook protein FlgE [Terricaulis silvestris]QGZ93600.1 Flagellar hook protein FlgE [Terricaulis silvestris]
MSIYTALRAGVSGLTANSSALAVISDNIANVNTVGYKRSGVDFSALVNAQNSNTTYNAGGVLPLTRQQISLQGSLEQSRSATDLAISGDGFFIVSPNNQQLSNGGSVLFTRAGSFTIDADGYMVNAQGLFLQGWPVASDGSVTTSPTSLSAIEAVNISGVGGLAEPTANVGINANLNSDQTPHTGAYVAGDLADGTVSPHFESSLEVFDSLGAPRTIAFGFLKTGPNTWQVESYARPNTNITGGAGTGGLLATGTLNFNTDGTVASATGTIGATFNIPWAAATGASTQAINLDLNTGMTQFAKSFGVTSVTADGVPPGDLVGLVLEGDGMLTAQFSNGRARALYQIPLATFLNPNGLAADQGGAFRTTLQSGLYNINSSNAGGAGRIVSGALEASNVDLAAEFTNLITTQRAYSAASRIITTADEMLEELLMIKR